MPILWRYLLSQYFKVLILSACSFICVLLVTRLDDIAQFASLGADNSFVWWFALYQIPYILPIAIPVSCLISSIILFQKLSHTHELTALRAAGLSLRKITAPILIAGAFLGLANFYLVSEVATTSHRWARQLQVELSSVNPLSLLQNDRLLRIKGIFVDVLGRSSVGESAEKVVFAVNNKNDQRINVLFANQLSADLESLSAEGASLISYLPQGDDQNPDHLMVENLSSVHTPISEFTQMMKKDGWKLSNDHLPLAMLRLRHRELNSELQQIQAGAVNLNEARNIIRQKNRCATEFIRRISVALGVFTFTLMGTAFGIDISRHRKIRGVLSVIGFACLYLSAYFIAKQIQHDFRTASLLLILPHFFIIFASIRTLQAVTKGVE